MINEQLSEKDVEGSGHDLIKTISLHVLEELKEITSVFC
jgi:hypothetical protein